jgi:BarA-like signal transduction histidine kinase
LDFSIDANPYVLFLILILLILSTENQAKAELIKKANQTHCVARPTSYGRQAPARLWQSTNNPVI